MGPVTSGGYQATQDHVLFRKDALRMLSLASWPSGLALSQPIPPFVLLFVLGIRMEWIPLLSSLDTLIKGPCKVLFLFYKFIFLLMPDHQTHSPFPTHPLTCVWCEYDDVWFLIKYCSLCVCFNLCKCCYICYMSYKVSFLHFPLNTF